MTIKFRNLISAIRDEPGLQRLSLSRRNCWNWLQMTEQVEKYYAIDCFGGSGSFARAIVDIMRLRTALVQVLLLDFVSEASARIRYPVLSPYLDDASIVYYQIDLYQSENSIFATLLAYFLDGIVMRQVSWIHAGSSFYCLKCGEGGDMLLVLVVPKLNSRQDRLRAEQESPTALLNQILL